jgi:hypothetical protein
VSFRWEPNIAARRRTVRKSSYSPRLRADQRTPVCQGHEDQSDSRISTVNSGVPPASMCINPGFVKKASRSVGSPACFWRVEGTLSLRVPSTWETTRSRAPAVPSLTTGACHRRRSCPGGVP